MNLLVTGGAGFIGSHLLQKLTKMETTVLDNLSSGSEQHVPAGMQIVRGDVRDAVLVDEIFADQHFDAVIHLAAQTMVPHSLQHPVEDCEINLTESSTSWSVVVNMVCAM